MRDHRNTASGGDLASVLAKQRRILLLLLPRARRGDPDDVHRARVATRRLREMLPVALHAAGACAGGRIAREVRRITRALGPVRELDVALRECALEAGSRAQPSASELVMRHLEDERERRVRTMRVRLAGVDRKALDQRLRALADECAALPGMPERHARRTAGRADWRTGLATRLRSRATRLAETLQRVGTIYAPAAIHDVRIAAKKLRYTIELAHAAAAVPCRSEIAALRRLQDILGRLHDLQVLQEHVRIVQGGATRDRASAAALAALDAALETECRTLHGSFLRRRRVWLGLADRVGREMPSELVGRRMARIGPAATRAAARKATA